VAPKVQKSPDRFPNFEPDRNTFAAFSTRQAPTSTTVWLGGKIDMDVGREDSYSLRIDGPDKAWVHMNQHVVEQHAEAWWIRGWFKSEGVGGRGLQLRVKYAFQPKPEKIFYIGGHGTREWTHFSFVTDVLKQRDCTDISFELDGPGAVWIDDVALTALKPGEEKKVTRFTAPAGVEPRKDMVMNLPMTEKPGRGVYDASHNGNHLMLGGDVEWVREDGRAFLRFDGVDDTGTIWVRPTLHPLDNHPRGVKLKTLFPLDAFTYEVWVRPRPAKGSKPTVMSVFHFRRNPKVRFDSFRAKDRTCRLSYQNDRHKGEEIRFHTRVKCGRWYHIVGTHGNGKVAVYVNGKKLGEAPYDTSGFGFEYFAYTWKYHVGCWYGKAEQLLQGDLGPFRLYTRALTPPEVTRLYKTGWPKAD